MPNNYQDVSFDELFGLTNDEMFTKAAEDATVFGGSYPARVTLREYGRRGSDSEFDADRLEYRIGLTLLKPDLETGVGMVFDTVSPEVGFDRSGRLDNKARKYTELARAVLHKAGTVQEVYEALKEGGGIVTARVQEVYKIEQDDLHDTHQDKRAGDSGIAWVRLKKEESAARTHYMELGYEAFTMIQSYRAFKA
jgi:hypothetical protein